MNKEILDYFKNTKTLQVEVNDKKYDCYKGLKTESGFYKNGFKTYLKDGKKKNKKSKYLQIDIFTSASQEIDIEERFLFLMDGEDYILKKWTGWNNVDLMRFSDYENEYLNMLKAIFDREKKN